ncbi:hypothetical protein [Sphingobium sp. Z007]|nr:hypothetical protein [Sphingobium sp. Z007]
MIKDEPIIRITEIERRAKERYTGLIEKGDIGRARTLGRQLVKLDRLGFAIACRSLQKAT